MRFVVEKMTLVQVFLRLRRVCPANTISAMLHDHFYIHVVLTRRTNGRSLGTYSALSAIGEHWAEKNYASLRC